MTIRERTQKFEETNLSKYASLSQNTLGRNVKEEECRIRTAYQRDRDRVIHSKSFRRLKHKTQVFISPEKDHYRTRLTHTLEVSQIARTISRALGFNEDLTEAISLAHDLGHTPFGHAGEKALDSLSPFGFKHYEQSVRVVDKLEKNGEGLNLTYEVKDGILCHTKGKPACTVEGRIVKIADRIAYINHDIDDAIRAGVLSLSDIPKDILAILGNTRSKRINTLVESLVDNSYDDKLIMSADVQKAFDSIHDYMYKYVYTNPCAKSEESKVPLLVEKLYSYFKKYPEKLPDDMQKIAAIEGSDRAVCDYIAGMTDKFAVEVFQGIFIPKAWNI